MLGRGKAPDRVGINGEARMQRCVHARTRNTGRVAIFDIGANEGMWLVSFFQTLAGAAGGRYRIHAFEPVPSTVQGLTGSGLEDDFGARVCRFDETNAYS